MLQLFVKHLSNLFWGEAFNATQAQLFTGLLMGYELALYS